MPSLSDSPMFVEADMSSGWWKGRIGAISVGRAAAAATGVVLLLGLWWDPQHVSKSVPDVIRSAPTIAGCSLSSVMLDGYAPSLVGADIRLNNDYVCGGQRLRVDIARYLNQAPGHEAIGGANALVDVEQMTNPTPRIIATDWGFAVRAYRYDRRSLPTAVWTWYAVGGEAAPTDVAGKLLEARHALVREQPESAVIVITVRAEDIDAEEQLLSAAAKDVWTWYLRQIAAP
jgi:hypothetical protein